MQAAAQRDPRAVGERHRPRHAAQALAHPVDVVPEKLAGLVHAASGGNRDHHRPARLAHPERESPRSRVAPHLDGHADALHLERDGFRSSFCPIALCWSLLSYSVLHITDALAPLAVQSPTFWPSKFLWWVSPMPRGALRSLWRSWRQTLPRGLDKRVSALYSAAKTEGKPFELAAACGRVAAWSPCARAAQW